MKTKDVLSKAVVYGREAEKVLNVFRHNIHDDAKVWGELVYCLCTPQTKAVNALKAVEELTGKKIMNLPEVASVLRSCGVRFHNTKARYIVDARRKFPSILREIRMVDDVHVLREFLVENVKGLGWKEASHFLRNLGFERVAVIDRHILRYLLANRLVRKRPKSLSRKTYLSLERKFIEHAEKLDVSPALLDLLIWASAVGEVVK
ncbi:MAG: N-glycosylase/DNA lyase [Candidatus Caldarchaeum sp.]|nr:N-glycosylase/DNA lyase [Candidatus Caldarchaeum sp.]